MSEALNPDAITLSTGCFHSGDSLCSDCTAIEGPPGSLNFKVERNLLVAFHCREIVRYFGLDPEIVVGRQVRALRKSCFESCKHLDQIDFEIGSEREEIGAAAVRGCARLSSVDIPASVVILEEITFEWCTEFESCLIGVRNRRVSVRELAKCTPLRSFSIPPLVGGIGSNFFEECNYVYQLKFKSSESLRRVIGNRSVDGAWYEFGVRESSGLFRTDVDQRGMKLQFPGWAGKSVRTRDGDLHLTLVRDIQ
jgi:hypothetical protein